MVGDGGCPLRLRILPLAFVCGLLATPAVKPAVQNTEPSASESRSSPPSAWKYQEYEDEMSGKQAIQAVVTSNNTVNFSSPYRGAQHARLVIRAHPRHGTDVILHIEKGQFLCSSLNKCELLVRFDEQQARKFAAVEPADRSSTSLFISPTARFLTALQKAKRVQIEATFYQEGSRVFAFDVSDLDAGKLGIAEKPATPPKRKPTTTGSPKTTG
jgi:hypothetical protein